MAVETKAVHCAASAEGQRVTRLVDNPGKSVGARYSCQAILRAMAAVDKIG